MPSHDLDLRLRGLCDHRYDSTGTTLILLDDERGNTHNKTKFSIGKRQVSESKHALKREVIDDADDRDKSRDKSRGDTMFIGRYEMKNTSTRLIILNNTYKRHGSARLKTLESDAQTHRSTEVDPYRHTKWERPKTFTDRHCRCKSAITPRFECPTNQYFVFPDRPKSCYIGNYLHEGVSSVNQHRHRNCFPKPETPPRAPPTPRTQGASPLMPVSDRPLDASPYIHTQDPLSPGQTPTPT